MPIIRKESILYHYHIMYSDGKKELKTFTSNQQLAGFRRQKGFKKKVLAMEQIYRIETITIIAYNSAITI